MVNAQHEASSPEPSSLPDLLAPAPSTWLVTGAAGFIGSHLLETLLRGGQRVVAVDDFSTGHRRNLDAATAAAGHAAAARLRFIEGDIGSQTVLAQALPGVDYVLHQAALGSVPRSLADPVATFKANVDAFFRLLVAAREAGVRRFVYASSSSVYGDSPVLPKREAHTGALLSPYAASKAADELFADVIARCYGLPCVGLRYFNVFGPRQDPQGPYAAVIPRWLQALIDGTPPRINGDGLTSRDFCYVANAVQANLRAALVDTGVGHAVYNVAAGRQTTLNQLFEMLRERVARAHPRAASLEPVHGEFRAGDVRHSLADVGLAAQALHYSPSHDIERGLDETVRWYLAQHG